MESCVTIIAESVVSKMDYSLQVVEDDRSNNDVVSKQGSLKRVLCEGSG